MTQFGYIALRQMLPRGHRLRLYQGLISILEIQDKGKS
jgi:hypothetical protein